MNSNPPKNMFGSSFLLAGFCLGLLGDASTEVAGAGRGPNAVPLIRLDAAIRASGMDYDEYQYAIAKRDGRFAGWVKDDSGKAYRVSVGERANAAHGLLADPVHSYRDLYEAKAQLRQLFADPTLGVVSIDIDESRNAVVVGYAAGTRAKATGLGLGHAVSNLPIASDLVVLESADRPTVRATRNDSFDIIPGGVEFSSSLVCTVGINVIRAGAYGFISANHCAGAAGSAIFQNRSGRRVGAVAAFGPKVSTNCPSGLDCRYADVAFYQYDTRNYARLGAIARTGQVDIFSNTISGYSSILSTLSNPAKDTLVKFHGKTTMHSQGRADKTCVDVRPYLSQTTLGNIVYFCQNSISHTQDEYAALGGDSGGPLFVERSGGVDFVGLVSSSTGSSLTNRQTWYSPWSQIEKQLGTLQYK